ncbi:armadillo-type protein [Boletus reticuloceps]|uniref:Armadillo-type protein n=1 Tax=Boletus reticuloceps TaxID=495285 RepID=A0A8I2Z173_9AGAM|nr:armadillo-type protein [Boletus reticuloceps]
MDSPGVLVQDEVVHRVKRFKHQSYAESLKHVHLPSALDLTKFDHDIADTESHFYVSLQQWKQLNLSPSFIRFAQRADPLSLSMPLLLHNWRDIVELWMAAVDAADDEGLRTLLDLLQKLAHDLRTTLSPVYADLLAKLLTTLSGLFSPEVQRAAAEVWASVLRRLKTSAREKAVLLMANNLDGVESASAWMLVFACKSVSSTLHTTSSSIMGPAIDCYLTCEKSDLLYTVLRRTLTSIIHHCKGADQFSGIAEILVDRFLISVISFAAYVKDLDCRHPNCRNWHLSCQTFKSSPPIETALFNFSLAVLAAGDMSMATSTGLSLLGALAELSWGGWKLVALPALFRSTDDLLTTQPKQTLRLFAYLHHADKLGEVDIVWKRTIDIWLCERLSRWELSPDGVDELRNLLSLLVGFLECVSCKSCLGSMDMHARPRRVQDRIVETAGRSGRVDKDDRTAVVMVSMRPDWFSRSRTVEPVNIRRLVLLGALSALANVHHIAFAIVAPERAQNPFLETSQVNSRRTRCTEAVFTRRGSFSGRSGWLISQLKVNLRPLWSPAAEALSSLAKRFGNTVWECLFDELQTVTTADKPSGLPEWLNENIGQDVNDDLREEERTWRDGAAHRMRTVISSWLDQDHDRKAIVLDQKPSDRFDPVSYETQLLSTLGQCASLAEKHNRELVPFFLSLAVNDDTVSNLARYKLHAWLTLFSKFTNPKALHATETLFTVYRALLSHPDRTLQTVALSCVLTYKPPNLVRHEETLRHFLDDTLWRDELAHLDFSSLDVTDRPMFVDTMIRLLFGIMLEKKGRTKGGDRRVAVLSALAVCNEDELGLLVDLMLKPMGLSSLTWQEERFVLTDMPSSVSPKQQVGFLNLLGQNTQAPSALLDVFYLWASRPEYVRYLVDYDDRVLLKVLDCFVATNVKPAVLTHIFDIVDRLLALASEDDAIAQDVVKPHLSLLLTNLTTLVERTKGDQHLSSPLAQRQISVLSQVAHHIADPAQASVLVGLLAPLLRKPGKVVPEKTKMNLLMILNNLLRMLSHLFLTFRSNGARLALTSTFNQLVILHPNLQGLAWLLESLNACSTKRINEPNFDRRLAAFTTLNEERYLTLSPRDWLPVLYNALHFVQDPEELAVRNNAAFTLRRFVGVVASDGPSAAEAEPLFMRTVLPALKNALRSKAELVRAEALGVIAHAVMKCERIASLQEMRPLLAGGDDEASFFSNIHHIQIHRRTRALRRLGEQCEQGYLRGKTLVEIFVPLVEHYIVSTASLDHLLVAEAINTLGRIARQLHWSAYYALVQKYVRSAKDKDGAIRVHARALVAILETFHFSMEEAVVLDTDTPVVVDNEQGEENAAEIQTPPVVPSADVQKVSDAVNRTEMRTKTASAYPSHSVSLHVALHLPASAKEAQIGKLLTVLSQALRSRSQETRDLVRETLCRIAVVLGPAHLPLALRELRAALLRGPHLHVLAYVTHALLTYVTSPAAAAFDDLDGCIDDIAHIASEVVFGESAKDVQHEDFKTKMLEVKGSTSRGPRLLFTLGALRLAEPDQRVALTTPIGGGGDQLRPSRCSRWTRCSGGSRVGFNTNARLNPPELLVLCHTLVSQNAKFLQEAEKRRTLNKGRGRKDDHIVQTKRKIIADSDHYAHNSYRFVVFGLDLFTTAYRRSRFDLHDAQLLARLEPFVNLIGNTLYAESEAVIIAALKAAPCILQCPLKAVPTSAPLMSRQTLAIIRSVGSAESEVAQTAFKSLATILRECPTSNIKEDDLLFLLALLAPDLEEPNRQTSVFALLRAIVARKLVVPELYDLMTTVSTILVTSQSAHTRESARSLLLQFLLDYPQGAGRLQTTLAFLARNLSYEHASGRSSVLELLHALMTKFDVGLMAKHAEMLFVALVLCLANDADKTCRVAAAGVIQQLLRQTVMGHLHAWAVQKEKATLRSVAVQVYGLVVDALQRGAAPYLDGILDDLQAVAESSCTWLAGQDGEMDVDGQGEGLDGEWHATYQTLQGLAKVLQVFPEAMASSKVRWTVVVELLAYPHAWVRSAACRLLGALFAASTTEEGATAGAGTEVLTYACMRDVADKLCALLKSSNLEASVALQTVKNLFFVGKWFVVQSLDWRGGEAKEEDSEDDSEDEDENEERDGDGESQKKRRSDALPWLFSKLSYQARSAQIARRNKSTAPANWALSPLSVLRFFAAMTSYMDASQLERFLPHILTPVYRITEEDTIRDAGVEELKTTAIELQDLVQAKVGTTVFASAYHRIRQGVVSVQQARRVARVTKATTDPEAAAKRKLARNVMKKESRKRKQRAFAESRGRAKRRREA